MSTDPQKKSTNETFPPKKPGSEAVSHGSPSFASLLKLLPPQTPEQEAALRIAMERVNANTAKATAEANSLRKS